MKFRGKRLIFTLYTFRNRVYAKWYLKEMKFRGKGLIFTLYTFRNRVYAKWHLKEMKFGGKGLIFTLYTFVEIVSMQSDIWKKWNLEEKVSFSIYTFKNRVYAKWPLKKWNLEAKVSFSLWIFYIHIIRGLHIFVHLNSSKLRVERSNFYVIRNDCGIIIVWVLNWNYTFQVECKYINCDVKIQNAQV